MLYNVVRVSEKRRADIVKKEKIVQIAMVISMYFPQIFLGTDIILLRCLIDNQVILLALLIVGLVFVAISFFIGILNVIVAILNLSKETPSPTRSTIIMKFVLIPWYGLNFLEWLLLVGICGNPWLMLAIPLVICIGVSFTFIFLLFTNVHNFSYVIKLTKNKKIKLTANIVIPVLFHFVFVLDILGSILLHLNLKKILASENLCEIVD